MIAEVITRKNQDNFKRLSAYVLNARDGGRGDPLDWKLAEYILDQHGKSGEKVASHRITNCFATDAGFAVKECLALAARNTRSTKDKSYHLVVSFPPGERPTEAQMTDIENTLVKAVGFEEHKRISAVHQDRAHWHLHVAIVTVHPKSFRNVTPYYDHYKLQQACIELEQKHNLTPTHHAPTPEIAAQSRSADARIEAHTGRISFARWVNENVAVPLVEAVGKALTWAEVHAAMAEYGLEIKARGAGLAIVNQANQRNAMKASAVDRGLAVKAMTDRFGAFEPAPAPELGKVPSLQYNGEPRGADPGLWERYHKERLQVTTAREIALAKLRADNVDYAKKLSAWYRDRYAAARTAGLNRGDRISTRRVLETEYQSDQAKRRAQEAEDRKQIKVAHTIPAWETFLAREGSRGDPAAMKTLERRIEALIRIDGVVADQGRDQPDLARGVGVGRG